MKTFHAVILILISVCTNAAAFAQTSAPEGKNAKIVIVNKPIDFTQGMLVPGSEKGPGGMYHGEAGLQQLAPLTGKRTDFRKEMLRDSIQSS